MNRTGYTVLGWIVWQATRRIVKGKVQQNRTKLGAAAVVAAVLVAGIAASKAASDS